jgi:hypothetical protein
MDYFSFTKVQFIICKLINVGFLMPKESILHPSLEFLNLSDLNLNVNVTSPWPVSGQV